MAKDEIYTIPVNDGFNEDCECAFCAMQQKLEQDMLDFVLSPSYMEEDVRGETNAKGFCRTHMEQLYRRENSLGVALIMQSQFDHQRKYVMELAKGGAPAKKGGLFGKKQTETDPVRTYIENQPHTCYICDRTQDTLKRYLGAFFILWKKDAAFREKVLNSKAFCLVHFLMLLQAADEHLSAKDAAAFKEQIIALPQKNDERIAEDINWFTLKFDYRYQKEPWKNSKDAVPRTIQKVNGQIVTK